MDFFVFFASPNASGIRITTPASKNTVVPTTSPVIPRAIPAFFSPNLFTRVCATHCAPPDTSRIPPNKDPRPISSTIPCKVSPAPFCTVFTRVGTGIPAPSPITSAEISSDNTGWILSLMISSNNRIIPTAAAINSLVGSAANTASVIFFFLRTFNLTSFSISVHICELLLLQLPVLRSSRGTYLQSFLRHHLCKDL